MKLNGSSRKLDADLEKVKSYWFEEPLRYEFGAAVNIDTNKTYEVRVLRRSVRR
jgi:hypothetical protein